MVNKKMIKNKKGQMGIVWFFVILFIIMVVGFAAAIFSGAFTYVSSTITPVFTGLDQDVGGVNLSEAGQYSIGTANTMVQQLPWIVGLAYVFALIGSIMFVLMYSSNPNPMWLGGFFIFMIFLILISIILSNAYQDIYTGGDELALTLQSMTIISFLILNSPYVFGVITVVAGIFMFAGKQGETVQGGYGV